MWDYLTQTEKPIVLYGTGNACQRILAELRARGVKPAGIIASDDFVRGQSFEGYKVSTYAQMKTICERFFELQHPTLSCPFEDEQEIISSMIVLLCFGTDRPEVLENIAKIEAEQELYAPDLPVIGEGLFTRDYYEEHFDDLNWLASVLADERSREVLSNVTGYRLTGELDYLRAAEDTAEEQWKLLDIGPDEVFADLGAYTGDTVEQFLKCSGGSFRAIHAFEPESRNFRKLQEYLQSKGLANAYAYNIAVGDGPGVKDFSFGSGRGSLSKKTRPVQTDSLDRIFGLCDALPEGLEAEAKALPTVIKIDIEGDEAAAIDGMRGIRSGAASQTLAEARPRLLVAGYHRIDDLWALTARILAIQPNYKVYLRHAPCVPNWETNLIFK
jgi:FkbM family methyltransferase